MMENNRKMMENDGKPTENNTKMMENDGKQ
jgi:hypothetical protein